MFILFFLPIIVIIAVSNVSLFNAGSERAKERKKSEPQRMNETYVGVPVAILRSKAPSFRAHLNVVTIASLLVLEIPFIF